MTTSTETMPAPSAATSGAFWDALSWLGNKLAKQPKWLVLVELMLCTAGIGWYDYIPGWEVSLFVLYAIPILVAVWLVGRDAGVVMALACGLIWWFANFKGSPYQTAWGYHWATISRTLYFLFVAVGGSAIRTKQQADAAQIRMLEEMRKLEKEIVSAIEHEQQRIGQDLHDGLCQQLAAIGCAARALADDLNSRAVPEAQDAVKIEEALRHAVIEARSLARGIFPVHVDRTGLSTALEELASTTSNLTGIPVEMKSSVEVQVNDPEVAMHLYRIAQEAVANAVRHSGATFVAISLEANTSYLELTVKDNGRGFSSSTTPGRPEGMGLRTMRYRAQAMGAEFSLQSQPGVGTAVVCRLRVRTLPKPSSLS